MTSYKVYVSGDSVEIYEYEHVSDVPTQKQQERNSHEKLLENIKDGKTTEQLKDKRRKQTLRDNAMNLQRMARHYFQGDCLFLTLTFADHVTDIDKADRKVKHMLKKLRNDLGETFHIGVREKTKKGRIHYHFLVKNKQITDYYRANVPEPVRKGNKLITSEKQKEYERYFSATYWKHGFVNLTAIDFVDNVGAYLAKYMFKGDIKDMEWLEGRRLILRSKEVKKIEPVGVDWFNGLQNIDEYMKLIRIIAEQDIINNEERKRVFTNGYTSEFSGKVTYYQLHTTRLDKKLLEKIQIS